jgi:glycosyltransferase involved in cell wall biosynthesis
MQIIRNSTHPANKQIGLAQADLISEASVEKLSDGVCFRRPRLLVIAFSCDPHESMEHRNGWYRALQAARYFDVTVLCGPQSNAQELNEQIAGQFTDLQIHFDVVQVDPKTQKLLDSSLLFYVGYRRWLTKAFEYAKQLEAHQSFDASHLVSLCGYREPGEFWKLQAQFLWGPIGGTSGFPVRFLSICDLRGGLFELARNIVNYSQLRFSRRIRNAIEKTSVLVAANRSSQCDLQRHLQVETPLELETGIDFPVADPKPARSPERPLRILWAGRLRTWKGLPILIYAIARLPKDVAVQVRVVGDGSCKESWKKLARRLGVEHMIEWIDRPPYRDSLEYYRWADVFSFTSLRDTSGTGLLESLAMGTPIVGLDHQGSADIMTSDCAIRIGTRSPAVSIHQLSEAIVKLAKDPALLKRLSDGSIERAKAFSWDSRRGAVEDSYERIAAQVISSQRRVEGVVPESCPVPSLTTRVQCSAESILES